MDVNTEIVYAHLYDDMRAVQSIVPEVESYACRLGRETMIFWEQFVLQIYALQYMLLS